MIVSTKGRYALRVMLDLCEHPREGFTPLQEISERQGISREYLNNILKVLVEHGLLESLRGKGGGYKLARRPEEYPVGAILRTVEGDLSPVACIRQGQNCPNTAHCRSHALWEELDKVISGYLDSVYLTDFMEGGRFYRS